MCIVCGVYCYRKKALKEDPNFKMPIGSRSRSNSASATFRHLNSDGSEMDSGTLKKTRSYDRVYRTHEPLEGKPDVEFPEKKWELDDADVTSSEGSVLSKDNKLAKDIQYIPYAGDNPARQMGRRQLSAAGHLDNPSELQTFQQQQQQQQQPRDEVDDHHQPGGFPPPPVDSPDSYSPTSSGLDRNSFMNNQRQQQFRPSIGAVRVLPVGAGASFNDTNNYNPNNNANIAASPTNPNDPFMSFSGASSPQPPAQDVGLPKVNTKSTEV